MDNKIAKEFTFGSFLGFVFPTIIMMIFMALYSIVDGMFVSQYVGSDALSAINIVYPIIYILIGIGIMFGTGGSAVVAKKLGEGKKQTAKENFTLLVCFAMGIGLILCIIMLLFIHPILVALGASERLYSYCVQYVTIILIFGMPSILQILFQSFLVTAGKPNIGLALTIFSGISNIIFDYIFIVLLQMGIKGAAFGTGISYMIGFLYPLFYFSRKKSILSFTKPKWSFRVILQSMGNGSSEMVSNLAAGVTTFLFNAAMLRMVGENGVAAITIVLYSQFLFTAAYLGFSNGAAPIISYNYGSGNIKQLKRIFRMCMGILIISSIGILILSLVSAGVTVEIFAKKGSDVYNLAIYGYRIFAWNFLFAGVNIFSSSLFTALSNGKASAFISFLRTFGLEALSILLLPKIIGIDGVWLAVPVAEAMTLIAALLCVRKYRKEYQYI